MLHREQQQKQQCQSLQSSASDLWLHVIQRATSGMIVSGGCARCFTVQTTYEMTILGHIETCFQVFDMLGSQTAVTVSECVFAC